MDDLLFIQCKRVVEGPLQWVKEKLLKVQQDDCVRFVPQETKMENTCQ